MLKQKIKKKRGNYIMVLLKYLINKTTENMLFFANKK